MTRAVSVGEQLRTLARQLGGKDLSEWEADFVRSCMERSNGGADTTRLSERQVEKIESIWEKHFA